MDDRVIILKKSVPRYSDCLDPFSGLSSKVLAAKVQGKLNEARLDVLRRRCFDALHNSLGTMGEEAFIEPSDQSQARRDFIIVYESLFLACISKLEALYVRR